MRRRHGGARAVARLLALGLAAAAPQAAQGQELPDGRAYELVSPLASTGLHFSSAAAWYDGDGAVMTSDFDSLGRFLSRRTPEGWRVERFDRPPGASPTLLTEVADGSKDLSRVIVRYTDVDALGGTNGSLARREADGSWTQIGIGVAFAGASLDASRIVVTGADPYPPVPSASGVFRWEDGVATPVGLDDTRVATCGAVVGDGLGRRSPGHSGVSEDGRVIVLTSRTCTDPDTSTSLPAHVLVWRDGQTVDVSSPLDGEVDRAATYVGSANDGSAVFFISAARIEPSDVDNTNDLFRYDVGSGQLERVSAVQVDGGAPLRMTQGVITSYDGRRAWFITGDAAGEDLWIWTTGANAAHVVRFNVGTLTLATSPTDARPAQITPDGAAIAWIGLPRGAGIPAATVAQAWRATAAGVACLTCDGVGTTLLNVTDAPDGFAGPKRYMSDDGRHVFFDTARRLLPEDADTTDDVYGWSDGRLWLVSEGEGRAKLAGVSPRGDVFFRSFAQLLPWVDDAHEKVYVARIGGGLPAPRREDCDGDACQGTPRTPGPVTPPASELLEGDGDVEEPERRFPPDPVPVARLRIGNADAAGRALARRGRATFLVRSSEAGRVTVTLRASLRGRPAVVGSATRRLGDAGTARVTVRLSAAARRALMRDGALRVLVVAAHPRAKRPARSSVVLRTAASASRAGAR